MFYLLPRWHLHRLSCGLHGFPVNVDLCLSPGRKKFAKSIGKIKAILDGALLLHPGPGRGGQTSPNFAIIIFYLWLIECLGFLYNQILLSMIIYIMRYFQYLDLLSAKTRVLKYTILTPKSPWPSSWFSPLFQALFSTPALPAKIEDFRGCILVSCMTWAQEHLKIEKIMWETWIMTHVRGQALICNFKGHVPIL